MYNLSFQVAPLAGLTALALLPVVYFWMRSLVRMSPGRRVVALVIRCILLLVVIAALLAPQLNLGTKDQTIVALVDCSRSDGQAAEKAARSFAEAAKLPEVELSGLGFAKKHRTGGFEVQDSRLGEPNNDNLATDIAAAITSAAASMPADRVGKIVLFSDGNQTEGDARAAAQAAGVPIFSVPVASVQPEVYVSSMTAPPHVRQGDPFKIEVLIQSTHEDDGRLELLRDSAVIEKQAVRLAKGENRFQFEQLTVTEGASAAFSAHIEGCKDTIRQNNQASCLVMVNPRPRALLVEGQGGAAGGLPAALGKESIDVKVCGPQQLPERLDELQRYQLVILANTPAEALGPERMKALASYVHDYGGGLVAVGGYQAFTAGGWHGTPLEELLPVTCQPSKPKPKPTLAMVLVLDVSYSMKGRSIDLARQALRRAVAMLGPSDQVGVLAFEDRSRWISPLGRAENREQILHQIDTIEAGGGTTMYPAIEKAYMALREAYADRKHIIVMTDGISNPGDFDALTKQITAAGITMSTVGVGSEPARPLLKNIAERAKGHAYFCEDAAAVPKIFEMEAAAASRFGITEQPFFPQVAERMPPFRDIDLAHAPALLGYVETGAKPGAEVLLSTKDGEPLLATWRYGLGTAAVFTSDAENRWAAAWLGWPGFGQFWAQLARRTMRPDAARNVQLHVRPVAGRLEVTLDAADSQHRFIDDAEASLAITDPKGAAQQLAMQQVAPGRYAATVPAAQEAVYVLEAKLTYQGQPVGSDRLGVSVPYPEELRTKPTNTTLLREIAKLSGGSYDPQPADVFATSDRIAWRALPLWPWLLAAALAIFLLDLSLRRIAVTVSSPAGRGPG
jgi:Ca-activated chloride channel homolog